MIADQLPFAEQFRDLQMEQLECSVLFILLRTKMKYFKMMTLQKALAACMIHSIICIGIKAICIARVNQLLYLKQIPLPLLLKTCNKGIFCNFSEVKKSQSLNKFLKARDSFNRDYQLAMQ